MLSTCAPDITSSNLSWNTLLSSDFSCLASFSPWKLRNDNSHYVTTTSFHILSNSSFSSSSSSSFHLLPFNLRNCLHANSWVRVCGRFNSRDAAASLRRTEGWFVSRPELVLTLDEDNKEPNSRHPITHLRPIHTQHAAPMPFPCHAVQLRVQNMSLPFDLHSAAMSLSHLPCRAHALLRPCRSSQGHGTGRKSRDILWATGPRLAFSGYHAEFHEGCYQKHTNLRCRWPV